MSLPVNLLQYILFTTLITSIALWNFQSKKNVRIIRKIERKMTGYIEFLKFDISMQNDEAE